MAETVTLTVISLGPPVLARVSADTTAAPCELTAGLTLAVNDRVTAEVRTPQMPLITGKEETS